MGKKKLFFFQPFIGPYRIDFTNDLSKVYDARIYLKMSGNDGQAFRREEIQRHLQYEPYYLPSGSLLKLIRYLGQAINDFDPDIIITFEFDVITLFILIWRWIHHGRYKVIGMSDDSFDMLTGNDFTWKHKAARRLLARHLDDIILPEPRSAGWYQEKYGIGFFFPIIRNENALRGLYSGAIPLVDNTMEEYDLSGKYVFLYVGRLLSLKNVRTLISAFANMDQSENRLVIVGDGPEMDNLKRQSEEQCPNVLFVGRKEGVSLYVWYLIANALVLPSFQEAFGAVTNEALVAGCSVIVSNRAGASCLIENGRNGFLFNPEDLDDLCNKMQQVKMQPEPAQGMDGIRESQMTIEYDDMFRHLCRMLDS